MSDLPAEWRISLVPDMLMLESQEEIKSWEYEGITTAEFWEINLLIRKRLAGI